ncbi:hypothetical protein TNCV_3037521 [Trichonephila clavipes]|nr:hypothetical protein TNCV_3037521 [Trichonephila clavipes]
MRAIKKSIEIYLKWKENFESSFTIYFIALSVEKNPWFLYKTDAISNKIPPKIQMDLLKFKFEMVEALVAPPTTNKNILTDDELDSVAISPAKRLNNYNTPAKSPYKDKI